MYIKDIDAVGKKMYDKFLQAIHYGILEIIVHRKSLSYGQWSMVFQRKCQEKSPGIITKNSSKYLVVLSVVCTILVSIYNEIISKYSIAP